MKKTSRVLSKHPKSQTQESVQYNHQDLDQQQINQNNPVQHNYQSVNVVLGNVLDTLCGAIKGTSHKIENGEFLSYVSIELYLPGNTDEPVEKCNSDDKGHFCIKTIPPGYYQLHAYKETGGLTKLYPIKILPGETLNLCIMIQE